MRRRASKLKYEAEVTLGKMLQSEPKHPSDTNLLYARAASVGQDGDLITADAKSMWFSVSEAANLDLRRGDVLVVEGGDAGRSVLLNHDLGGWGFQNSINRVRSKAENDSRFIFYVLHSARTSGLLKSLCDVVSIPHLTAEKLKRLPLSLPDFDEQRAIADYLDRETAEIDTLIAKQEQLIATLRERGASLLDYELVAAGLQSVPRSLAGSLQDALPPGWKALELGQTLDELTNGFVGPTRDILVDEGVPYIQSTHIKNGAIDFHRRPYFVAAEWHAQRPRIHLREGDILIVQTGDIGKAAVVPAGFGEASCHALQIARVRRSIVSPQYLGAYLASVFGYHQLRSRATGALHPHLEAGIRSTPVIVPPLHVQRQIVAETNRKASVLHQLIEKTERFIELAKERRSTLITAAVTGRIDVRAA